MIETSNEVFKRDHTIPHILFSKSPSTYVGFTYHKLLWFSSLLREILISHLDAIVKVHLRSLTLEIVKYYASCGPVHVRVVVLVPR